MKIPNCLFLILPLLLAAVTDPAAAYQSGGRAVQSFSAPQQFSIPSQQTFVAPQAVPQRSFVQPSCSGGFQGSPVISQRQPSFTQVIPQQVIPQQVIPQQVIPQQVIPQQVIPQQSFSQGFPGTQTSAVIGSTPNAGPGLIDPIFQISNASSPYSVDHSAWNNFLSRYVGNDSQGVSRVTYGRVTPQDRQQLGSYLQQLQNTDIRTLNRNEQFAFWVNLYNARTTSLVLENYPISSVNQINGNSGPFDLKTVSVLGKNLSLNEIESGVIRPIWQDPRIHYALNCASYGCPNLAGTAYTAQNLDQRLNTAAVQFINTDRAVQRTAAGPRVSKIYEWYQEDFGGSPQGVLNHIRQYADGNTLSKINGYNTVQGYYYDWSLNDGR